jgi:hypothetical protein
MFLGSDLPQVDFRGKQLERRVEVGQIRRQSPHFVLVMLDQPGHLGTLADQGRNDGALCHEKFSWGLKTGKFSSR